MIYKINLEQFNEDVIEKREFESASNTDILNTFDRINWTQQIEWGFREIHQGDFLVFEIKDQNTGRLIGGLFTAFSRNEYNFHAHAELYQKQQKSYLFGLFKSSALPTFDNENLPFTVFRDCLALFLNGNDAEIEALFSKAYEGYVNTGIFDK